MDVGRAFAQELVIGTKKVGSDHLVLIIAEAGVAHFGDMEMAKDLVAMSAEAGADMFKIQVFDVDQMISSEAMEWKDRLRARNLTFEQVAELKELSEKSGMEFMFTPHDASRLPWIDKLQVNSVKIGSGEKNNTEFIKSVCAYGKPTIISTGMCNESDFLAIQQSCLEAGNEQIALLHCVTSYPHQNEDANISVLDWMRSVHSGPIGYSDHSVDGFPCLVAVARGARIIERHITIKTNVPNAQDWKVSSTPDTFPTFVKNIREIEKTLGDGGKAPRQCEVGSQDWALKSIVLARDVKMGAVIGSDDMIAKRPGTGLSPHQIPNFVGSIAVKDLHKDDLLLETDVKR